MMHDEDYLSFIDCMEADNLFALGDGCCYAFSTMMRVSAVGLEVGFAKGREVGAGVGSTIGHSVGRGLGKGVLYLAEVKEVGLLDQREHVIRPL